MTERWQSYFEQHGAFARNWLASAVQHWGFHEVLYGMIRQHCPPPARILDVGSGPGWSDLYLASIGYEVTGVDTEPSLVALAGELSDRLSVPARFEEGDAFDLNRYHGMFDLVFSCGVLEHFDREVTVQLLQEQARCAPLVLIQIPTRYTAYTGEITDERIYSVSELKEVVKDAGLEVAGAFGYGDVMASGTHVWVRRILPRALWRWLQNRGFCYAIAVVGKRSGDTKGEQ